jgi:ATP-dependent DNA ligase
VIGLTGESTAPRLVLGLRHADGRLHHFAVTRSIVVQGDGLLAALVAEAGPDETAIRSRCQHDAVPPWRRLPAEVVCEVSYTTLDAGRWLRQPEKFLRWRPDRSPDDCDLEQLAAARG